LSRDWAGEFAEKPAANDTIYGLYAGVLIPDIHKRLMGLIADLREGQALLEIGNMLASG
jgi:hypothetical protein